LLGFCVWVLMIWYGLDIFHRTERCLLCYVQKKKSSYGLRVLWTHQSIVTWLSFIDFFFSFIDSSNYFLFKSWLRLSKKFNKHFFLIIKNIRKPVLNFMWEWIKLADWCKQFCGVTPLFLLMHTICQTDWDYHFGIMWFLLCQIMIEQKGCFHICFHCVPNFAIKYPLILNLVFSMVIYPYNMWTPKCSLFFTENGNHYDKFITRLSI